MWGHWGSEGVGPGSWVPSPRASLVFLRRPARGNGGGLSLTFFLVQTSVVGGAGVRKGKLQPAGRLGISGVWVVPGQWPKCVQMSPLES